VISRHGFPKLVDFGISTDSTCPLIHHIQTTPQISAPESFAQNVYSQATDWWSFGCLLFEMATGKKAFDGLSIE
jgi:serine/threonine protein kinase